MRIVNSTTAMQRLAKGWRRTGTKVGFVPTMGYLHAGHMSLVKQARRLAGAQGKVVLSIYVNPTQFGPSEDLSKYPRDLPRDTRLCREAGVDVIFFPSDAQMYPGKESGLYSTYVLEEELSQGMEGGARPAHFRGVTTIVAKLFNLVLPDFAVFGAKDWQQAAIVKRMVQDLNFPLRLVVAPTVREPDGLAMSSRNKYLSPEERAQAIVLWEAIGDARRLAGRGKGVAAARLKDHVAALVAKRPAARLDYVEFFDPDTLRPVEQARRGTQMALAVFVGRTRLIDNASL